MDRTMNVIAIICLVFSFSYGQLQDRIQCPGVDPEAVDVIAIHEFTALLYAYFEGQITGPQLVSELGLNSTEQDQVATMKTAYDALSTDGDKAKWMHRLESYGLLFESGIITATQYKNWVGF